MLALCRPGATALAGADAMSPLRIAITVLVTLALAALMGWQLRREQTVKACHDSGGVWHGPESTCKPFLRPILRRDLERS